MDKSEKTNIDEVINLVEAKKFKDALKILVQAVVTDSENAEVWKYKGLCEFNLKRMQDSYISFKRATVLNTEDAVSLFYQGCLADLTGHSEQAEEAFLKVLELRPDYIDAYKNLVVLYLRNGQADKIEPYEKKLFELGSDDYQIFYMLGTTYMAVQKYEQAIELFKKALEITPRHALLRNNLGSAYLACGKLNDALESFRVALEEDEKNPVTHYNIAVASKMLNDNAEAYKHFKEAYSLEPSPFYLTSVAGASLEAGEFGDAVKYYTIICTAEPDKSGYKFNLACAYQGLKDYDKTLEILKELSNVQNIPPHIQFKTAEVLILLKDYSAAKLVLNDMIKKGKANPDIYYQFAVLCANTGDKDKAEAILKKVIQLKPDFAVAHKDLAVLYLDARLFDYAKEEFEKAYELDPVNPFIVYEYGNYFQMTGDADRAAKFYDAAIKAEDLPPDILLNIALNNLSRHQTKKATELLERAVKQDTQNIDILFNLGKLYFIRGNKEGAKQLLEDAFFLEKDPETANMLAQIYFKQKDYNYALKLFTFIDEKYPNNTANLMNLAKCCLKLKNKDKALEYLHRYTEIFPEDPDAIAMLAELL